VSGIQVTLLTILLVCIGASGLFSGSETAIVALPRERVHQLESRGARGRQLAALVADTEGTLGSLLVANNFVNILGASIATILAIDLLSALWGESTGEAVGPWLSTVVITAVVLVVGEITPKTLAARRTEEFALFVAPVVWGLNRVISPVTRVFVAAARAVLRLFGVHGGVVTAATEDDIMALAVLSEAAGEIHPEEREILESLFELADRPVRDVMTPRVEVIALEVGSSEEAARRAVGLHGHSRFPIVTPRGTLDDLVGVLYVKDLLRRPTGGTIDAFVRKPVYIPESVSVLAALQELRTRRVSFGVVLDEHGGVDGVITVKDLVAELVGDIQDEYDPREPSIYELGDRMWVVEGRVPVEDVVDELGVELPDGPYSSIGGLFLWVAGRIPDVSDVVEVGGLRITVLRMDKRRIDRLRMELVETGEMGDASIR
jgi:CBS domain containing-hemolysin-like protein